MEKNKKGVLHCHKSDKFSISAKVNENIFSIFKISFHQNQKNEFAIIASFPFFKSQKGVLSRVTYPSSGINRIKLTDEGYVTSNLVKYTHWEDGNTHFSQTGKVKSLVSNKSNPLNSSAGHLFTVQLQGLEDFKLKNNSKKYSGKEIDIEFEAKNQPDSLKFVAHWINSKNLRQSKPNMGKIATMKFGDVYKSGFILSPSDSFKYNDFIIFLYCEEMQKLAQDGSHLTFIGGFDPFEVSNDHKKDLHFISFAYPIDNFEEVKEKIGSIDL